MPAVQNHIKLFGISLCFFWCLGHSAYAQLFYLPTGWKRNAIDFKLIKNLIVVPVYLNGQGPFNFVLDSGISSVLVTDTALKDRLKPKLMRKMQLLGYGNGVAVDADVTNLVSVKLGEAFSETSPAIFLNRDLFDLSGYLGVDIAGLIGYPFFKDFIVQVNYSAKRLVFGPKSKRIKRKGERIPFQLIDKKPYLQAVLTVDHHTYKTQLMVDCGASHAVSLERLSNQRWQPPNLNIDANLGIGLGGAISGKIARIQSLNIGHFKFKSPLASFPKLSDELLRLFPKERNGNLGADILKRFIVTYDYTGGALYLKKNSWFSDPFEHDMAGLEIYAEGKNFFVARVEPNSPAEIAGFEKNDQLIGINFKSINEFSLNDLTELFKNSDGNTCVVEIFRKNIQMVKVLHLKRRI